MKLTAHNEQNGVITLKCKRGSVCEMIAGYQQTREHDAAHIVKCVNAHDELVAALQNAERFLSDLPSTSSINSRARGVFLSIRATLKRVAP